MEIDLGKFVFDEDKILEETLIKIIEKENNIIKQYKILNEYKDKFPESFNFKDEIEKRKMFILFKKETKEKQYQALLLLLDYLNLLDNTNKNAEICAVNEKLQLLKSDLSNYSDILL